MIRGRYYFTPSPVRWIKQFVTLTSANYARGDVAASTILGEDVNADRNWDTGTPPTRLPNVLTAGDRLELTNGCAGDGTPPDGYYAVEGIDARCFTVTPPYTIGVWDDLDPNNPAILLLLAQLLEWSYTDPTVAQAFILFWFGLGVTVDVVANSASLVPGTIIIRHPRWTIVVISGTSNPQQLAMQALFSPIGPVNMGGYSTMPLWQIAAQEVADRMSAFGVDPALPILVTGHSYGGAVGSVLTEMLRRGNTARPLRLVTFGSPAPGDFRLQRGLRTIPSWHFSTLNDPVPQMPITGSNSYGLQAVLPLVLRTAYQRWQGPSVVRLIDTDPGFPALQFGNLTWTILLAIATAAALGRPTDPFPQHNISQYLFRLRAMNPGLMPWPIPAPVKARLVQAPNWNIVDAGRLSVWSQ